MKRKIIQQGHNTLTVSLPRKWCDSHKLTNGNEVDVDEKGNCLIISKTPFKGERKAEVDVTGLDSSTIILLIQGLYAYGYDEISINTKDDKVKRHLADTEIPVASAINYAISTLVGAELVSSTARKFDIEIIVEDSREKFDTILRRIFLLINEMFDILNDGIKSKDRALIDTIPYKHMNIKRFINYSFRILNKLGHDDADKTTCYYSIITYLRKITEITKHYTGYVLGGEVFKLYNTVELDISKKPAEYMKQISELFRLYSNLFYKYDIKKVSELHMKRDLLKKDIYKNYKKMSKEELFVVIRFMPISDIMLDLIELRMALSTSLSP